MKETLKIVNTSRSLGTVHLLAEIDNSVVGRSIALHVGTGTALLEDFKVDRSVRGQGIGTALLSETERLSKEQGVKRMIRIGMFCDSDSPIEYAKAVRFMHKRGYSYRGIYLSKKLP